MTADWEAAVICLSRGSARIYLTDVAAFIDKAKMQPVRLTPAKSKRHEQP